MTAVLGVRCRLQDRLGTIAVARTSFGADPFYLNSFLYTGKNALLGNVTMDDGTCRFHKAPGATTSELLRPKDLRVVASAGGKQQAFTAEPQRGELFGPITLGGDSFALEVTWAGNTVFLPAMQVPAPVPGLSVRLEGSSDAPQRLDVTWTAIDDGAQIYTLIPINHHAAGPTFTECSAPTSHASFSVPKDMLTPLAVKTGLEFQNVQHVRFAAAELPAGCVEFSFSYTDPDARPQ